MPALAEATAVSMLISDHEIPYIVSFMIRKNGTLIDGNTIHNAIEAIDAAVRSKPLCYMANCVHPDILRNALSEGCNNMAAVRARFKGIQANAAREDPDILDSSRVMVSSTAEELLEGFKKLNAFFPLKIFGGCCGTTDTHIRALADWLRTAITHQE